jgi:DNA-binding response OmpR family regulator
LSVILVVEDDADINVAIQDVLGDEGYHCKSALNGDDGFRLLIEDEPALVLLDLDLPGMRGTEFLEHKEAVKAVSGIPVIVITGLMRVPKLDKVVAVLRKPFTLEALLELVRTFVSAGESETA